MIGFQPLGYPPPGTADTQSLPVVPVVAAPAQEEALIALRLFLLTVLPAGVEVIQGQDNRVSEPAIKNYVVLTPIRRMRLSTNIDDVADCVFTGSINGATLTVSEISRGSFGIGSPVFGVGVLAGTKITGAQNSLWSVGTYTVSPPQIVSERELAAGIRSLTQHTQLTIQCDVHGDNGSDNAQIVSTTLRDSYAADWFAQNHSSVAPLYADDPKQVPFLNAEQQYEDRWAVEIQLQINPAFNVPQQFAEELKVTPMSVEAIYPARS